MKVLICYKSKYGSTRQYAEWINKEIKSDIVDIEKGPDFSGYDVIIFGSYLRMGKITLAKTIIDNWDRIKDKQIVLFATRGLPADHPLVRKAYEDSLPEGIRKKIKYFQLSGRLINRKLTLLDKMLMFVGSAMEKDKKIKRGMRTDFNSVKQENLAPLLNYLKTKEYNK